MGLHHYLRHTERLKAIIFILAGDMYTFKGMGDAINGARAQRHASIKAALNSSVNKFCGQCGAPVQ